MTARRHLLVAAALLLAACGRKAVPIPPELARPEPPAELAAIATADGVRLGWERPLHYSGGRRMNDLAGFSIERAPGEGGEPAFVQVGTLEVTDQNRFRKERHVEWIDHDVAAGARYLYRVRALTLDGYRSVPAGPVAIRFGPGTPAAAGKEPPKK